MYILLIALINIIATSYLPSLCPRAPDVNSIAPENERQAIKMAARWRQLCSAGAILFVVISRDISVDNHVTG